ncbi:hypothetical protein RFI_20908 [Reticulomyxa filosa]|uniref:Uncharacterized protein n=1 Tax=Reticulomyxa filosa TaxID=46433 RepID=X6MS09_RETFI|nr:hypothetical protein RFI_20908 [Reticulomyxa filosa]|eukprot:ETO16431.1 hypothetical protein RFI_20908 [Reticulomyxa filosa]
MNKVRQLENHLIKDNPKQNKQNKNFCYTHDNVEISFFFFFFFFKMGIETNKTKKDQLQLQKENEKLHQCIANDDLEIKNLQNENQQLKQLLKSYKVAFFFKKKKN